MAFGTLSGIFKSYVADALGLTASFTPHLAAGGTWQAALFGNTGTPDNRVASANAAYNVGAWVSGNEVTSTEWPATGRPLAWGTATRWASGTGDDYSTFDSDDTAGSASTTLANVYGDLVLDNALTTPVAKQALCFHAYGGAKGVTGGTFTIQWHANGVARWTHTAA
jgi:hypothetical protein